MNLKGNEEPGADSLKKTTNTKVKGALQEGFPQITTGRKRGWM